MIDSKVFVPPIKIQGIKTKLVPTIKKYVAINKNTTWVEPFMGSGVVGFNVAPENAVFSDVNPHIIGFYKQIQCGKITPGLVRAHLENEGKELSKGGNEYYLRVRNRFNVSHDPLDFLFLNRCCFNGMIRFNRNNEFNVPFGHKPERFSKAYITKIVNQVAYVESRIKHNNWVFNCESFNDTLAKEYPNMFVYCDPPYIGRHVDYFDSWDENDEIELCRLLKGCGAKFMLSTWDHTEYRKNEYIEKVWCFCSKITKEHFYHVGAKTINRKSVTEALLTNYSVEKVLNQFAEEYRQSSVFDSENKYLLSVSNIS